MTESEYQIKTDDSETQPIRSTCPNKDCSGELIEHTIRQLGAISSEYRRENVGHYEGKCSQEQKIVSWSNQEE